MTTAPTSAPSSPPAPPFAAPSFDFAGRIALVTGAGSGIGKATALGLARGGATVVCLDVVAAAETAAEIERAGGRAEAAALDVRDAAGWEDVASGVLGRHGRIDILVGSAGIAVPGDRAAEVPEAVWDRILDINAKGVWLGMRAVLPAMVAARRGKIVNVASTAAHIGLRDAAAYCASKGAVLALTRQAGVQYAADNIQINSVSPGTTMTGIQRDVTDEQRAAFLKLTPIGRFAEADEVAAVILFLCSAGSSFMAGADVGIDGGMVAF
ncbi:SDR family NAD(P)-dependent oxidoreductase [Prosthecomicrobium pneumaticum]|uniref:Cyclopentanol dehydrogenase n=1 Tax=Prosthecomicrobium pneumaticum TaxID=81895 RepID=A0A7W9FLW3_9HYPH|nr:SDR family oxidoreductase [Prosthecomicrobium pneumaticum]MBB5753073.1 cyclopentanol dehydrogenase [Prosthecomicrobium pneumaticum]